MLTRLQLHKKFLYIQFLLGYSLKYTTESNQKNLINETKQKTITGYVNICLNYKRKNNDKPYGYTI